MFATLNLQLTSTFDGAQGLTSTDETLQLTVSDTGLSFSDLLSANIEGPLSTDTMGGDPLPPDGIQLPPVLDQTEDSGLGDPIHRYDTSRYLADLAEPGLPGGQGESDLGRSESASDVDSSVASLPTADLELNLSYATPFAFSEQPPPTLQTVAVQPPKLPVSTMDFMSRGPAVAVPITDIAPAKIADTPPAAAAERLADALLLQSNNLSRTPVNVAVVPASAPASTAAIRRDQVAATTPARPLTASIPPENTVSRTAVPEQFTDLASTFVQAADRTHRAQQIDRRVATVMPANSAPSTNTPATMPTVASEFSRVQPEPLMESIGTPVRSSGWGSQLGERVLMMAGTQVRTANIQLTPTELGPLRVHLTVDEGSVNVAFQAQHVVTRDAIEQALPRLREMLADSGVALGETAVGDQEVASGGSDREPTSSSTELAVDVASDEHVDHDPDDRRETAVADGLLDTFA